MKKLFTLLSLFVSAFTFAQLNYIPSNGVTSTTTYTDLGTNGSAITLNSVGNAITYNDDNSATQNIGFNFTFNGTTFTQFVLNTNGFIKLGATAPATANIPSILNTTETNCIAAFNMDLYAGLSPEFRVYTSGSVGSRVCVIQFKNMKDYHSIMGQYANINFQILLYETSNNIEFVYGTFTPSVSPAIARSATVGIMGNNSFNSVNITKGSSTAWSGATFMEGPYTSTTLFNHRNSTLPVPAISYKFVAQALPANDAKVYHLYTLGKIPAGYSTPQTVQAVIKNSGSTVLNNVSVSLNVTGANSFSNTKTITTLNIGEFATVSFDSYTPTIVGTNTVTVSVPSDGLNTNNSYAVTQTTTSNILSSTYTSTTSATYTIGNITPYEFATKFKNVGTKAIDQITCYYPTSSTGQPYTVSIYDASGVGGLPGATALWTSTSQTTAGANADIIVTPAISVTGDFYVSVTQTGTTTIGYAYEVESPLRSSTFYTREVAGIWNDMAALSAGNCFRLMMDVRFSTGLPVSFNAFFAERKNNLIQLNWNTSCENNSKGFEVEKSLDGVRFSKIGFVASKATANNCTNLSYVFADEKNINTYCYYRLKQIDNDGSSSMSKIVCVKVEGKNDLIISSIYPNPAKEKINVSLMNNTNDNFIQYDIVNANGKKMITGNMNLVNGQNILSISTQQLGSGKYTVIIYHHLQTECLSFIKL